MRPSPGCSVDGVHRSLHIGGCSRCARPLPRPRRVMTPLYARTFERGGVRILWIENFSSVWVVGVAPYRGLSQAVRPAGSREHVQDCASVWISRVPELWHESCHDIIEPDTGGRKDDALDQARPR